MVDNNYNYKMGYNIVIKYSLTQKLSLIFKRREILMCLGLVQVTKALLILPIGILFNFYFLCFRID